MAEQSFLDFYQMHGIIPARQELRDLDRHFHRRRALYLQLGIIPALINGRSVIEFGPGPGDNAIYTAQLRPSNYVFVDGNKASLDHIIEKERAGWFDGICTEHQECRFLDFHDDRHFDLVLAEACIPGQSEPTRYLRHIAGFASHGGAVVTTTQSYTSMFSEVCRRMVKPIAVRQFSTFNDQISFLVDLFKPDLDSLQGMSRLREDWVIDQILHPYNDVAFTIPEAITALSDSFDILGSSPRFVADWRWYKTMDSPDPGINDQALEQYYRASVSFLDRRCDPAASSGCDGRILEAVCKEAFLLHVDIWAANDVDRIPEFTAKVEEIATIIESVAGETAAALRDFSVGIEALRQHSAGVNFGSFSTLFGRAQQYISFVRRPPADSTAQRSER